jgi:hypothetical protein
MPPPCPPESGGILLRQGKRLDQALHSVAIWMLGDPALQVTDGAHAHLRPLGQFLLGEPSDCSMVRE